MTIPKQHSSRLSHQALDFLLLSVLLLLHYEDLTKVKAFTKLYDEDDKAGERATELQPNNYEQFMILFLAIGTLSKLGREGLVSHLGGLSFGTASSNDLVVVGPQHG